MESEYEKASRKANNGLSTLLSAVEKNGIAASWRQYNAYQRLLSERECAAIREFNK